MTLTEDLKKQIDSMDYQSMLSRWRFAPLGDEFFQGEVGTYFSKVMKEKDSALKPEEHSRISKDIGWER